VEELDRQVLAELRALPKPVAETVGRRLVTAGRLLVDDPEQALAHAVAARRLASRIAVVREAVGLAAYYAGEWQTAIGELRTYHRMSGRQSHLAILADCERALGRPERAVDIYRAAARDELSTDEAIELVIVAAAARADLGQRDAAVAMLQVPELGREEVAPWAARLRYAYADALLAAGRQQEAREWFARAAAADEDALTDAAERLLDLDGVVLDEADLPAEAEPEPGPAAEPEPAPEPEAAAEPDAVAEPDAEFGPEVTPAPVPDRAVTQGPAYGSSARLVDGYDLVILDLDGVVYLDDQPLPAVVEALAQLRPTGPPVVYATNNASRSADDVAAMLAGMGVAATAADVLTSAMVAAGMLAAQLTPGSPVLVVGTEALAAEVRGAGLRPVRHAGADPVAVLQGYGPQVGWEDLAEASVAIRAGARWVVTNPDTTRPSPRGPLPGNGALVAALRTTLRREPDLVVGKPAPALFQSAARRTGAARPLVVGDRLDTDIDGALSAGMDSLLVLTGVDSEADLMARDPRRRPTYVGGDLAALLSPGRPAGQ
jgi:glycerol-1-phosphatase